MSYHAAPHTKGGWAVRKTGAQRASAIGLTRANAWKEARRLARGVGAKAYLHGRDGRIVARNNYSRVA